MSATLLRSVVFGDLAARGVRVCALLEPAQFSRLAGVAGPGSSPLEVSLTLSRQGANVVAEGEVRGSIELVCRRCLESFVVVLDNRVHVGIVERGVDYAGLPEGYEAFEAPGGEGRLADVVEEEVLLALPDNPVHADPAHCGPLAGRLEQYAGAPGAGSGEHPFAVLAQLKGKHKLR